MAGIALVTDLEPADALKAAGRAAKRLDFSVRRLGDRELAAQKGSLPATLFLGAFAAAYCDFRIRVLTSEDGDGTEIEIERNRPWWTGVLGLARVKDMASQLANWIADAVEENGGKLLDRYDF